MKYSKSEFTIDKRYNEELRNKKYVFEQESGSNKAIHITMVTTYGVKRNQYYPLIQSEVTMNDLFK